MDSRTKGAWLISHTKKLMETQNVDSFEDIELAGKAGIFLSNLAASDEEIDINPTKVSAIAKVSQIKKTEIKAITDILKEQRLIDTANNGAITVLGLTTSAVLNHTADIFDRTSDDNKNYQEAALAMSDMVSEMPKTDSELKEFVADTYRLESELTDTLFQQSLEIGFLDSEKVDKEERLCFNGNLFRKENMKKTQAVLASLNTADVQKVTEFSEILNKHGCISEEAAIRRLGENLFNKLIAIGMYDRNEVSNTNEIKRFITKPSAFGKFGNSFEEDALDLAKVFVTSLYYGMNFSTRDRGRIWGLGLLLGKLIRGSEIGPATAIGQDYQLLELKGVIKLRTDPANKSKFYMKLLKKDIGELALEVLQKGNAAESSVIPTLVSGSITQYSGPEKNRKPIRKKIEVGQSTRQFNDMLRTFRTC